MLASYHPFPEDGTPFLIAALPSEMAPQLVAGLKVQGAAAVPTLFPGADHLPILPLNLMVTLSLSV